MDAVQQLDGALHPDAPVAEQPSLDADGVRHALDHDRERRNEVEDDVVVVAGIERDPVGCAGLDYASQDVEGAVAVERRNLDGDYVLDRGESALERDRKWDAANRRLQ